MTTLSATLSKSQRGYLLHTAQQLTNSHFGVCSGIPFKEILHETYTIFVCQENCKQIKNVDQYVCNANNLVLNLMITAVDGTCVQRSCVYNA